jgi:hypothetical protein
VEHAHRFSKMAAAECFIAENEMQEIGKEHLREEINLSFQSFGIVAVINSIVQ